MLMTHMYHQSHLLERQSTAALLHMFALADKDAFWEINYVKIFAPEPSMAKSKSETKMNVGKSMSSRGSMKGKSKKKKEIKKNDTSKKQRNSDNKSKKATVSKTMI